MQVLRKMTWVELKLFVREPFTVVFTFAIPLMTLFVLGSVFGNHPDPSFYRGFGAMNFYVPAYIALSVAAIGLIVLPVHFAAYREQGILRRFRASSIPVWSVFGAQVIVTCIIGALSSLPLVAAAAMVYTIKAPSQFLGVVLAFLLGTLSFAFIGLILGTALPNARAAQGAGLLLWFLMFMVGGAGPPSEALPATMRTIGDLTPLKHFVTLMQDPWLGLGWNNTEMLIVGSFLVVSVALTYVFAQRTEKGR